MNKFTRRQFLNLGCKTLAGAGLALGADPMLTLARAAEPDFSDFSDYRALVCIYLHGGCDGFSLLVPRGPAEYNEYAQSRQILSVDNASLLALNTASANNPEVGFHPSATALQQLFEDGQLAMVANVGNLVEPTSKEQYENKSVVLPTQLFSHADQEIQWQQLQGRGRSTHGWGALAADYLSAYQEKDYLTSISLDGSNYWQSGFGQRPYSLKESGILNYAGMDTNKEWELPRSDAFWKIQQLERQHLFSSAYADVQNRAIKITTELGEVLESNSGLIAEQPEDTLSARLGMVAQLIAAQEQLGLHRQIFYVRMGGFDVHDHQNSELPVLFDELSSALGFFQNTLEQMGKASSVTTFTASDFGRTLTGNGDGTDHGWGNHMMVMGGAVQGGDVYGTMPRMNLDGPDEVQNGRVLPTLASAQYAATMLRWIGLQEHELDDVLPTLSNFSQRDLGFMI